MKTSKTKIATGTQVAFNLTNEATWFDVLDVDGFKMTIRETGTNYAEQYMDTCYVKQVRMPA